MNIVLAGAVVLAGIGGSTVPSSATARTVDASNPPPTVRVEVEFPRYLHASRTLESGVVRVLVENHSTETLEFEGLAIDSPLFEAAAAVEGAKQIVGGSRFGYQTPLGAAICPPLDGDSAVVAEWRVGAAEPVRARVVFDDADLLKLHTRECATRAVFAVATITLDLPGPDDPLPQDLGPDDVGAMLSIERVADGNEPVTVTAMRGSAVIVLTRHEPSAANAEHAPVLALTAADDAVRLPVRMRVARCDIHATAESKKTMVMNAWVRLDGGDEIHIELRPTAALEAQLSAAIDECASRSR